MDVVEALKYKKAIEAPYVADVEELLALLAAIIARLLSGDSAESWARGDRWEQKARMDRDA